LWFGNVYQITGKGMIQMLAALPTFLFPSWKGMHAYSAGLHGAHTASLGSGNHLLRNVGLRSTFICYVAIDES
jgi:hypothetical protein